MIRVVTRAFLLAVAFALAIGAAHAARPAYVPALSGTVVGYRLAGVEPDGDPLDQVVLRCTMSATGAIPRVNLIVSSYLENFRPDTTPVLPDLLHPSQDAHNLGGFLQGKALLTDDAGNVLYIGSFLAEAFLNNTNHAVMTLYGSGSAYGGGGHLSGTFSLAKTGQLTGHFRGKLVLSAAARKQIAAHRGQRLKSIKQIISVVTVVPHYYGTAGNEHSGTPLHTGFSHPSTAPSTSGSRFSIWTILAAAGALASLALAAVLYFIDRRRAARSSAVE